MQLFDIDKANKAWDSLCAKHSRRYNKTFTAWERLSYFYRHEYNRNYDGGILRVIAMFGEGMIDIIDEHSVAFQPGPGTYGIGSNPIDAEPKNRYLLNRLGRCAGEDEHVRSYIKEYVNAWHETPGRHSVGADFSTLHRLLAKELQAAQKNREREELDRLIQLRDMMVVLQRMR